MPVFVGGARHGTEWEAPSVPPPTMVMTTGGHPAAAGPPPPPSLFVDPATGDQFTLVEVTFQLPHPLTGQPDQVWTNTVYLHASLAGDPNAGMAALQDAVTRWWFRTSGTHKALSTPDKNGHEVARITHLARCEECGSELTFKFPSARAVWMTGHMDATGHKVTWSDEEKGTEDGGQRIGNVQEG
jgi:hypothetical protein